MLKKAILLAVPFLFGCSGHQDYYHGYVYDRKTERPIAHVLVKESQPANAKSTYTDANGYFKIENKTNFFSDLIFSSEKYLTDTAVTAWTQHGERLNYSYVNKKPDTMFLRLNFAKTRLDTARSSSLQPSK